MNILVTGGAGYIGSVNVEALIRRGHKVVVLDNLSKGYRAALHPEAGFVSGDIADKALVGDILGREQIEAVMHFAAYIEVGESMQEPFRYFNNNSAKTLALLEAMVVGGVKKLVFSSTAALFGTPETVPIAETSAIRPQSVYGESKYLVERMLHWFSRTSGLGYTALRYFNACGANGPYGESHKPETHLIPLVLQVAQGRRESISIYGDDYDTVDGTCVRDYVHVSDLAAAHVLAVENAEAGKAAAYNLGNGRGFSVREVIDVCREVTGHPISAVVTPRREGDPAVLVADSRLIKNQLGWQPRYTELREIVASAWEWHRVRPQGYPAN